MGLQLRPDVSKTDTEYGAVLLDQRSGEYWQLNPTGALIVRMLLEGGDPDHVATVLTKEYDVEGRQAEADVAALLDGLRSARLVNP